MTHKSLAGLTRNPACADTFRGPMKAGGIGQEMDREFRMRLAPSPDVSWALALTAAAVLATWLAVDVWVDPPEASGLVVVAVLVFTMFAWFGAACTWWGALREPESLPAPKFRVVTFPLKPEN